MIAGKTLDSYGNICLVFECEICGLRSKYEDIIKNCKAEHIKDYHEEEAQAGIL